MRYNQHLVDIFTAYLRQALAQGFNIQSHEIYNNLVDRMVRTLKTNHTDIAKALTQTNKHNSSENFHGVSRLEFRAAFKALGFTQPRGTTWDYQTPITAQATIGA